MARWRVVEAATDRVRVAAFEAPEDPEDADAAAALLRRTVRARRLGDPGGFVIQGRHHRRGWIEHQP